MWGFLFAFLGCSKAIDGKNVDIQTTDLFPPGFDSNQGTLSDPITVGNRLLLAGEAELALNTYYRAIEKYGVTPEVQIGVATSKLALGRITQAETDLRNILVDYPENISTWNNLGVA